MKTDWVWAVGWVCLACFWCGVVAQAEDITWMGTASGRWDNTNNWSLLRLPGAVDHVIIPEGTPGVTNYGGATIDQLTLGGALTLNNTLTLATTGFVSGTLNILSGGIGGAGDLTIAGAFNWVGGTLSGSGRIILETGATGTISGSISKALARVVENHGTLVQSGTGASYFYLNSGGVLDNRGAYQLADDSAINYAASPGGVVTNQGVFEKTGGVSVSTLSVAFKNAEGGSVGNRSGGALNFNGWFSHTGAGAISTGIISITSGSGALEGTLGGPGVLRLSGGTLTITHPAVLGNLQMDGGTLSGDGDLTVTQALTWTAGQMSGAGKTILAPGAAGRITGSTFSKTLTRILENHGVLTQFDSTSYFYVNPGGVVDNQGAYYMTDNSHIGYGVSPGGVITNRGVFEKTGGLGASTLGMIFNNAEGGAIGNSSGGGALNFSGWFSHTGVGSISTGTISMTGGSGALEGTIEGPGVLQLSGGTLNITNPAVLGNLQLAGGTLSGGSDLTVTQALMWTSGQMGGAGRTILAPGTTGSISGATIAKNLTRILENRGVILQSGTGNSYFNLNNGGVLDNQGTYQITDGSYINSGTTPEGVVTNRGLFEKTGGAAVSLINAAFRNVDGGILGSTSANIVFSSSFTHTGTGAVYVGCIGMTGGSGTLEGHLGGPGVFQLSGGTLNINQPAVIGALWVGGGTLAGGGDLTVTQRLEWTGGTMSGAGRTILAMGAEGAISGNSSTKYLTRILENRGVILQSGTGNSYFNLNNGGVLDNQGSYQITDGSYINAGTTPVGVVTNRGLFEKTGGAAVSLIYAAFRNEEGGLLGSTSANIVFNSSFTHTGTGAVQAGTITLTSGSGALAGHLGGPGVFQLSGGTVNINQPATIGALWVSGGTLAGPCDLTVTQRLEWTGGTLSGTGRTIVATGAVGTISSDNEVKILTRILENRGLIEHFGTGNSYFNLNNGGILENCGTYRLTDNSYINNNASPPGVVRNRGLLEKTGGAGVNVISAAINNMDGGVIGSSTTNINFSYSFSQAGTGAISTGTVTMISGSVYLDGTLGGPGRFQLAGGTLYASNASAIGSLWISGGTVSGNGDLSVTQQLEWTGGSMGGAGRTLLPSGARGMISGNASVKALTRIFENQGVVEQFGTGNSYFNINTAGVLDNQGVYQITDNSYIQYGTTPAGIITNQGLLEKAGGSGTSIIAMGLENRPAGIIQVTTGTLNCSGGVIQNGIVEVNANATLQRDGGLVNNGILRGQGTVNVGSSRLVNNGMLAPGGSPGLLTISGNFTQTVDGVLQMELGGTTVGTEYDRLAISGNAALGGALHVVLTNDYAPAPGAIFVLLTQGSRNGDFASTNLPLIPEGSRWGVYRSAALWQLYREPNQTTGGVATAWYRHWGVGPGPDEAWTQEQWDALDGQDLDYDGDLNSREYVADTDPLDSNDWFRVVNTVLQSPPVLHFNSSTNRLYTLHATPVLTGAGWNDVPGQGPRPGIGGADSMTDTNEAVRQFHRIQVAVP